MESKAPFRYGIYNIVTNMGHFDRLKIQKLGKHQLMYPVTYVLTSLSQISLGRKMSERRQSLFLNPW